jgi:hypothetical protein
MAATSALGAATSGPASWLSFTPSEVTLAPGATALVRVSVLLPGDAPAGTYSVPVGPVRADLSQMGTATGGAVGSGVAMMVVNTLASAVVTFTVAEASPIEGWIAWLLRLLTTSSGVQFAFGAFAVFAAYRIFRGPGGVRRQTA